MRLDQAGQGYIELEPFGTTRPMVRNLLVITVGMFLFDWRLGLESYLALRPYDLLVSGHLWQLLSYGFLHADFMHLFFNMFGLWMFGTQLERIWGGRHFLIYYLSCIVGAGVFHILAGLLLHGSAPAVVGASGAIYGLIAAYGVLFARQKIYLFAVIPMKASTFALLFGAIALLSGLAESADGVAHFAHLGGMLTGLVLIFWKPALVQWRAKRHQARMRRVLKVHRFETLDTARIESQVDALLDKINRQGIQVLSREERRFLDEASAWLRNQRRS